MWPVVGSLLKPLDGGDERLMGMGVPVKSTLHFGDSEKEVAECL